MRSSDICFPEPFQAIVVEREVSPDNLGPGEALVRGEYSLISAGTELANFTLLADEAPTTFVVSDIFVQLVTGDPSLDLRAATPVDRLKLVTPEDAHAEDLFARFVEHLDRLATSDQAAAEAPLIATLEQR